MERLIIAAKANRNGQRDATMRSCWHSDMAYGRPRLSIYDGIKVDLGRNACLHVRRVKNGMPSVHPLKGDEMRALQALKRESTLCLPQNDAVHPRELRKDGGPIGRRGRVQVRCSPAHAAPRVWLRTGEHMLTSRLLALPKLEKRCRPMVTGWNFPCGIIMIFSFFQRQEN